MQSVWNVPGRTSGENPPAFVNGEPPPFLPPDPPDPATPLSPVEFPTLTDSISKTASSGSSHRVSHKDSKPTAAPSFEKKQTTTTSSKTISMEIEQQHPTLSTTVTVPDPKSENTTVTTDTSPTQDYSILPPKTTSPIQTNKALTNQTPPPALLSKSPKPTTHTHDSIASGQMKAPSQKQTLVEKLRASADMSLKRLAPVSISPSGRPRIVIPDDVFKKGAEIHKDFIICYFNGKSPPFNQIQSVFNHMWGKGKRLEIHNNPLNRSVIVRIHSEYLRQKILEKSIWYVGDSMFHTAQWNSAHSMTTPPLKAIRIWAHLTGVPLDLRHDEGLSLVAGLVGEPKETDEFTRNLVSLTVSHVKVEVDLTEPLPPVVEFERESGEVVEVSVHYPWVPPTCSHCKELGHIVRNCLTYTPPLPETGKTQILNPKDTTKLQKDPPKTPLKPITKAHPLQTGFTPAKPQRKNQKTQKKYQPVITQTDHILPSCSNRFDPFNLVPDPPAVNPSTPSLPLHSPKSLSNTNLFSTPDPIHRPSLKRSRSSPILSPPTSSTANPFYALQNTPLTSTEISLPCIPNYTPPTQTVSTSNQIFFSFGSLGAPPSEAPLNPSQ